MYASAIFFAIFSKKNIYWGFYSPIDIIQPIFFVYENIFELFKSNHFKFIYIFENKKSIDISMDLIY